MATLRELRQQYGLTQQAISDMLHIPKRTIEGWDEGTRTPPPYVMELIEFRLEKATKTELKKYQK